LEREHSPLRMTLTVAGLFPSDGEESEYCRRVASPDLAGAVEYAGFVAGTEKSRLLAECDCLCFPSYYHAESFGLVVVEAMAAGMAVVTTRWRAIPELLPADYVGFVPQRDPAAIAHMLQQQFVVDDAERLRAYFLANFTEDRHVQFLTAALQRVEEVTAASA
ncbi:MAG: glycosyltransferase family 4 protein, partial [Chthoniobacteraceae bacterium]